MPVDGVARFPKRAEPPTPPSGKVYVWLDSTSCTLKQKDDTGTVDDFNGPAGTAVDMAAIQVDRSTSLALTTTPQAVEFDTPTSVESNSAILEHIDSDPERLDIKEVSNYHGLVSLPITNSDTVARVVTLTLIHSVVGGIASRNFTVQPNASITIDRPFIVPDVLPIGYVYITLTADVNSVLTLDSGARATLFQLRGEKGEKGDTGDAGENTKAKVSANDTTEGYLFEKIIAGSTKVSVSQVNDGGDEDLSINIVENQINHANLMNVGTKTHTEIDTHINSVANPHSVTKTQVGLANVDNTSDLAKPISTATQTALDGKSDTGHTHLAADITNFDAAVTSSTHSGRTDNPHSVTKTQVGLSNVPNTDATLRSNHTGTQTASTISDFQTTVSANTDVTANTAKVSNATHTGEVTGSTALTVDKTAITNKTSVTADGSDQVLVADASDSDNLKRVSLSSVVASTSPTITTNIATATATTTTTGTGVINSMTLTPASGTYLAIFSASGSHSVSSSDAFYWIEAGGTKQNHSERDFGWDGGSQVNSFRVAMHSIAQVTVNGSQTIEVRWDRGASGTFSCYERSLTLIRVA